MENGLDGENGVLARYRVAGEFRLEPVLVTIQLHKMGAKNATLMVLLQKKLALVMKRTAQQEIHVIFYKLHSKADKRVSITHLKINKQLKLLI